MLQFHDSFVADAMTDTNLISRMFGRSPVEPLQKHFNKAYKCARKLPEFMQATFRQDWPKAEALREKIILLEHAADERKRQLRLDMPRSLFMPVNRMDVLEMVSRQDRIANRSRDISGLIIGRRLVLPEAIQDSYYEFLQRNLDAIKQARRAVHELDELFASGFRGVDVETLIRMTDELNEIEDDTDSLQVNLRGQLFKIENDLPPVDVMFMYRIFDLTGDLGNLAQSVAGRLHLMIIR